MEIIDSCRYCVFRGDTETCNSVSCSTHESWYAKRLKAQLAESESERLEQSRLLSMGAERELCLRDQLAEALEERARLRETLNKYRGQLNSEGEHTAAKAIAGGRKTND